MKATHQKFEPLAEPRVFSGPGTPDRITLQRWSSGQVVMDFEGPNKSMTSGFSFVNALRIGRALVEEAVAGWHDMHPDRSKGPTQTGGVDLGRVIDGSAWPAWCSHCGGCGHRIQFTESQCEESEFGYCAKCGSTVALAEGPEGQ